MSNLPRPQTNVNPDLQIFPGYNSAVNAVTRPNQVVWTTHYFVDRWMPLLGGNGTMIVLALRRGGFLNRATGECRDEIITSRAELAARAGISEDTLTRELGDDRKTGKPRNPWLRDFVQPRRRTARNSRGQMQQIENAYWVSMDDPIHPGDWPLVEAAAEVDGWEEDKAPAPGTQNALPVEDPSDLGCETPETHSASSVQPKTQNAVQTPQNAAPGTQNALTPKNYSSLLENIFNTTNRKAKESGALSVVNLTFEFEDHDEDAAPASAQAPLLPPSAQTPEESTPPILHEPVAPVKPTAPLSTPQRLTAAFINQPASPSDSDAVDVASQRLFDQFGCEADAEVSKMRQGRDSDADIAQILIDAFAETLNKGKKAGYAVGTIRRMSAQRRAEKNGIQTSLESKIAGKLEGLPVVNEAELDDIRARYQATSADVKAKIKLRAEKMIHEASGSLAAHNAIPQSQFSKILNSLMRAIFLDWEAKAGGGC